MYVNNWCGADGEPTPAADSSARDYNTLPHYQRYQRCLQHQQQACIGHYHTGQRSQLMYEAVGRSRDAADGPRATLCSRHGRSNSLSPGRARYAAGQLYSSARLRRPLMPAAASEGSPAAEAADTATVQEPPAAASESPSRRDEVEQSASSTVDDASVDAAQDGVSESNNVELCVISAEPGLVTVPDTANQKQSEQVEDTGRLFDTSTDLEDLRADTGQCTGQSRNDGEVAEAKIASEEQNLEELIDKRFLNQKKEVATNNDLTATDDLDGDLLALSVAGGVQPERTEELSSKDWLDGGGEPSSERPVIQLDQMDMSMAKFDSSALEKILSSLSATSSRRDNDDRRTTDDNDDGDDQVWMRRDVVDDCQSSLSVLDAAAARLDNGFHHFKSRRRSSCSSSSSSSSVGHCSPSCLIPSTLDTDADTSTTLLLDCVTQVDASVDATATLVDVQPANLPSDVEQDSLPASGQNKFR